MEIKCVWEHNGNDTLLYAVDFVGAYTRGESLDAAKEKMIREAEGEAQAIKTIQQANADGIKMLKEAGADEAVLKLKSLEAFEKVADGQATTILLPAELQGIASVAATLKETAK